MSWDLMVFRPDGPPIPIDEIPGDYQFPEMGSASEVRGMISTYLPGIDWSDPTWGVYRGEGFIIEFNMGSGEVLDGILLHVRGGGHAVGSIVRFVKPNGWVALDYSTADYLDLDNPSQEGWLGFHAYRDHVVGETSSEKAN
jgi:hypothetical protein